MDFSFVALIGIVLLMGIVKKNAIMMIDFALEAERTQGMSPRDSIVQASLLRFRPIMMTTLAALFGALPLALESGTGSELRNPLGVTIIGGLLLSQLLTLYTTPVIYLAMERVRARLAPAAHDAPRDAGYPPRGRGRGGRRSRPMNFSRPFIERPIGTTLLAIGLFLLGVVAYVNLPVASLPSVEFPTIRVNASLPGADPETMAARVAAPLERRLGEIAGVNEMTSVNSLGSSRISIQFDLTRNIDGAAQDVQAAINAAAADLPADMPTLPSFRKSNPSASPILILALTSKTIPASDIYDAADTVIAQRISQVEGVAEVTVAGAEQPAIRVRVNPMLLSTMGLSIEDVRTAIVNANALSPLGIIDGAKQAIAIETNAQLRTVDDYKNIIIKTRQRQRRAPVRRGRGQAGHAQLALRGDVQQPAGDPADHHQERRRQRHRHGRPHPGADPRDQALDPGRHRHLRAVRPHHDPARQRARHAAHAGAVDRAGHAGRLPLPAARPTPTIAAGITVPLSLAGTCAAMWAAGFSINNLTLMALAVSVGFVVDDAIVMIENMFRNLERGASPMRAALDGARQIGFTVISISVSLVAAFIPLLFMDGIVGRLLREFSVTLVFAIAVSTVVSLTVTPMICAHFVRVGPEPRRDPARPRWSKA